MTTYVFENMSADDAANFTAADSLIFSSTTLLPADVTVTNSNNLLDLTSVTAGGKTLSFGGSALAGGDISFTSAFIAGQSDSLFVGSFGNNTVNVDNSDNGNVAYGFYGADTINGAGGADVIFGGGGADNITAGAGNDHVYGFALTGTLADDGADTISAGAGNDYVQGNAGADVLDGGSENDRIFGGNDNDTITGGTGQDSVNGNMGADSIDGGAGNDSLRGGQGNDIILGGADNDVILGDLGNDTITGGTGLDLVTGGGGADTFAFASGDATFATTGSLAFFPDTITDFTDGTDKIDLPVGLVLTASDVLHAQAGITLTSVAAAYTYAQQLLDANTGTTDVAALNVGSDAYLFYNGSAGVTIDSLIKLSATDAANITIADII